MCIEVTYDHVESDTGTLTANQTTILANSSASPVYFYMQADGAFSSVNLVNAVTGQNVATMLDDGQYSVSGDDLPNDDIYSCIVNVPSTSVGTYQYYARMTDSYGNVVKTNVVEISVVSAFAGTELDAMEQVHDSLEAFVSTAKYQSMNIDQRAEAVKEQLQIHVQNGLINGHSIKYDTRNQMYTFTHSSGVLGGIMLAPFHSDLNGSAPMTRAEREAAALAQSQQRSFALMRMMPTDAYENMDIGDAMIFYAFDDAVNSSRYPHYLSIASDWSDCGLYTSINQSVTVDDLTTINDYKVAVLSMHGIYYQSVEKSGAALCLLEEANESRNERYTPDLKKHNLATVTLDSGETCYWVYASFFDEHYGANDLQNTFIFSEACSFWGENSTSDKSMALALEKAGATAVVGFYNPVYTEYSRDMLQCYVNGLLTGKTSYEALNAGKEQYGNDDSKYTSNASNSLFNFSKKPAYALFGGSADSKLIESVLMNASFEQTASASGWKTTGDVRILMKLGPLKPADGNRMAILTTGIGSAESSYLDGTEGSILSQYFIVPSDAGAVQFQYDVVSEEPTEYVDSIFDDTFAVRILGANGQVYEDRVMESVNESTWYPISGINFEGGDDTTYHTQWKTGVIDLSAYRGKAITLQFVVYDMGDSIYDTAALVDDVKLLSDSGVELAPCSLHLSESSWTPVQAGESTTVSVTRHDHNDFSVKVTQLDPDGNALDSANEWLTASKSGNSIKLTTTANYAAQPRTAKVTVTCACGQTKKLIVTQMAGAPKPTAKVTLQSSDATYTITGINNDYTDRFALNNAGEDTLYVKVNATYAGRIFATLKQVGGSGHALTSQSREFNPTQSSAVDTLSFAIPKDTPAGTYRCTVYVSNSAIPNAVFKQNADAIEFDILIHTSENLNRQRIIDRAEEWMKTYWRADGVYKYSKTKDDDPITNNTVVHGAPYVGSAASSGSNYVDAVEAAQGKSKCRFTLANFQEFCLSYKTLSGELIKCYAATPLAAKDLQVPPVMLISGSYQYGLRGRRYGVVNGLECVGFVLECMSVVDGQLDLGESFSKQADHFIEMNVNCTDKNLASYADYSSAVMGDAVRCGGHVILVSENHPVFSDGKLDIVKSYMKVYEQTSPSSIKCLCDTCQNNATTTIGTKLSKYTYKKLATNTKENEKGEIVPDPYTKIDRLPACE